MVRLLVVVVTLSVSVTNVGCIVCAREEHLAARPAPDGIKALAVVLVICRST